MVTLYRACWPDLDWGDVFQLKTVAIPVPAQLHHLPQYLETISFPCKNNLELRHFATGRSSKLVSI